MSDLELLLVNPSNRLEQFASLNELATVAQPLGITMLASYIRNLGYSVKIIDAEAEFWTPEQTITEIVKYNQKIVCLTAFTTKMTAASKILNGIREHIPQTYTVLGGHHVSSIPERTLHEEKVDIVVKGEGYDALERIVESIVTYKKWVYEIDGVWVRRPNGVHKGGQAKSFNIDEYPLPAWDLLPMDKYRAHHWQTWECEIPASKFAIIYTSLGCPFSCEYCSVNVVYDKHFTRYRSVKLVADELEKLINEYGVYYVEIIDDTFTLNKEHVEDLCDEFIKRKIGNKISAWCFARTDRVSVNLMKKMKQAGIDWVFMGFESGADLILKGVNKRQTVEQIKKAVEIVHEADIHVGGNYVFGLPDDTFETMQATFDLAQELNTEYINLFVCMAYPGTKLYEIAKQKGYPLPERWGQYGFFAPDAVPMRTETLTPKDILTFRDKAFKEYFSSGHYQGMIKKTFGQRTVDFINQKVLNKELVRK